MIPRLAALLVLALCCTTLHASSVSPLETKTLVDSSTHILIGVVEAITTSDDTTPPAPETPPAPDQSSETTIHRNASPPAATSIRRFEKEHPWLPDFASQASH